MVDIYIGWMRGLDGCILKQRVGLLALFTWLRPAVVTQCALLTHK
jgi:hypothetical protein